MLKTNDIHKLATLLKLEPQDLEAKIKSEGEEDITLPELNVFTKEELETRLKNEKSTSYNDGKEAGVEMLVKQKKQELGYDFEGKDFDSLLNHHTTKIKEQAGKPNERVAELENDIKKLNQTHQQTLSEKEQALKEFQSKYNQTLIHNQLLGIVPNETTIPKEDVLTLFKANYQTELNEEGRIIIKKDGQVVKDPTTASERELKDVFNEWVTERKYVKRQEGRGGGNEFGGAGQPKSISGFQEQWKKQNPDKSLNSAEYEKDYGQWRATNKEVTA